MAPTPALLPGGSQGLGSLAGCRPWGLEESDTTERLRFHFSVSCIGEGNGISLQCSCLENPRDRGAWWAAVYRVTKSWTRLKRLSSSSSSSSSSSRARSLPKIKGGAQQRKMLPAKEGLRWLALRTGPQSLKELMVKKEYFQSGDRRGKIVWELREFHCCGIEGLC